MLNLPSLSGMRMGAVTAMTAVVLDKEEADLPKVDKYVDAVAMSLFNLLFVGPMLHAWLAKGICGGRRFHNPLRTLFNAGAMVVIHSGMYAVIHRCMHRIKALRHIHGPHHMFVDDATPTVANAVSPDEFIIAYMMPFIVGTHIMKANEAALNIAVGIVSAANLWVHSPRLKSQPWPAFLVSPKDHLEHHSQRTAKYAAPTIAWFRVWRPFQRKKCETTKRA